MLSREPVAAPSTAICLFGPDAICLNWCAQANDLNCASAALCALFALPPIGSIDAWPDKCVLLIGGIQLIQPSMDSNWGQCVFGLDQVISHRLWIYISAAKSIAAKRTRRRQWCEWRVCTWWQSHVGRAVCSPCCWASLGAQFSEGTRPLARSYLRPNWRPNSDGQSECLPDECVLFALRQSLVVQRRIGPLGAC